MHPIVTKQIRTIRSLFDYRQILRELQQKGKQLFGDHFMLYKEDLHVLVPIIAWMLRDEDVAAQCSIDLKKGIFLSGPIGVGKTQIMQLMRYLTHPTEEYKIISCTKLALDFGRKGPDTIHEYTYGNFKPDGIPQTYCFDDLGKEIIVKHYGTSCQIMQQIFHARYELFIQCGMITHATSSLHTLQIEERYGAEIRSRLREMFNRIGFNKGASDKRRSN
ncbi:ATPase [Chitinophaga sp. CF418]|uniref:ATPase n=1 Tax=Chitinophaga sp. CF418 TaxID=1855287 RepID=UPI00091AB170|nr:ATPase [Chitinophaga sp. CF418]SHN45715.1 hypothetical protein SAMN05216311_12129 [Chitinophaga sp. CF418]